MRSNGSKFPLNVNSKIHDRRAHNIRVLLGKEKKITKKKKRAKEQNFPAYCGWKVCNKEALFNFFQSSRIWVGIYLT